MQSNIFLSKASREVWLEIAVMQAGKKEALECTQGGLSQKRYVMK